MPLPNTEIGIFARRSGFHTGQVIYKKRDVQNIRFLSALTLELALVRILEVKR